MSQLFSRAIFSCIEVNNGSEPGELIRPRRGGRQLYQGRRRDRNHHFRSEQSVGATRRGSRDQVVATTRKLSLTAAGRTYFDQVRGALAQVREASTAASEMGEEPRGNLRVTAPPAMVTVLIPFLAEFLRRYPRISIELLSSQRIEDLVEQSIDLAVRIGRLRDSSLIARRVGRMVTALFDSKRHVKSNGSPNKPSDLAKHNCILFRGHGGKDTWRLSDGTRQVTVEVGVIGVDEIPYLHQAILAGIGIGSMSFFRVRGQKTSCASSRVTHRETCPSAWFRRARGWSRRASCCSAISWRTTSPP